MKCNGQNKIQHLPGTDDDNRTWCNSDSPGLGGGVLMGERRDEMIGKILHTRAAQVIWRILHEVSLKFVKEVE